MNNRLKQYLCFLLLCACVIGFSACFSVKPSSETVDPCPGNHDLKPDVNVEHIDDGIPPLGSEDISEADEAYRMLVEKAETQRYMRATGHADYVSSTSLESISEDTMTSKALELLGHPHFIYPYRTETMAMHGLAHAYVVEDGSVFVFYTGYYEVKPIPNIEILNIFHGSITQFASHLEETLYNTPLVVSDPDETKSMIHDTIMSAPCTTQNVSTDYPTFDDAKKIYSCMTVEEVDAAIGTPHYVQLKDEYHNETRFYVLSNGVLMVVNISYTTLDTAFLSYYRLYNAENIMQNLERLLVYTPKV